MKIKTDLRLDPPTEQADSESSAAATEGSLVLRQVPHAANGSSPAAAPVAFDVWTVTGALARRWWWLVLAACLGTALGLAGGRKLLKNTYTASAELVRYDSPNARELAGERHASATFASLLRSPEILRRVSERAQPAVTSSELAGRLRIMPERDTDVIVVDITGRERAAVADLANIYAEEAVRFTKTMQTQAAAEAGQLVTQHLARVEAEIAVLNQRLSNAINERISYAISERLNNQPKTPPAENAALSPLQSARERLNELLAEYTEFSPLVQAQRARIAALEKSEPGAHAQNTAPATPNPALSAQPPPELLAKSDASMELASGRLQPLETARLALSERQRTLQLLQENPPGYFQVLRPATPQDVVKRGRDLKVGLLGVLGGAAGLLAAGMLALGAEALDKRMRRPAEVVRVTGLPVLAAAGNLYPMHELERRNWAFRAWTNLQWHLTPSPNHSLVCGFTSDDEGANGFPWVALMSEAASQRGFRVLTIETCSAIHATRTYDNVGLISDRPAPLVPLVLDAKLLASPDLITPQLTGPEQQALLRIPLPGWVWNLARRNQWQAAIQHWTRLGNVVILVELPPAPVPESLLLAESLPNLIWVSNGRTSTAAATRRHVQALRQARCHLAGAVLSHAPPARLQDRFARWLPAGASA